MRAFTDTVATKAELISVLEAHAKADNFTKGIYWEEGKGCAVGCSLESFSDDPSNHFEYERVFGIPKIIARLEDGIFEGLSNEYSKWWPLAFASAITEGSDLSMIWPKFCVWLLSDKEHGVIRHAKTKQSKKSVLDVADLYKRKINGENIDENEFLATRKSAAAAAYSASDAAYASDADAAAAAAAYSAAADAAAYPDASAARQKARKNQADKLISLLKECK